MVKDMRGERVGFDMRELVCGEGGKLVECREVDIKEIGEKLGF